MSGLAVQLFLAAFLAQEGAPLLRWFVAPDGDDSADGAAAKPDGRSGPFRTLRRAFDEVRAALPEKPSVIRTVSRPATSRPL